eukprot:13081922-Ditylum_brightwellii.AAC.1
MVSASAALDNFWQNIIRISAKRQAEVANQGVSGIDKLADLDAQDISDMAVAINKMQNAANPIIRFIIVVIKRTKAASAWYQLWLQMGLPHVPAEFIVDERDEMMI